MPGEWMEQFWHLGRWRGVPVSLHWTVLLAFPWLYLTFRDFVAAFIGTGAFVVLIVAHESGHVLLARLRKVSVESITLFGLHGETTLGYASTRDEILVAWGGVIAQAIILVATLAATPL